ncbi:MraY family glycosyltransferase [Wenzhouxiangella sp. EGI_FJ10305]|uniref:MraY family glycosyltransferase n=1 Tax=Wenzhouxiangella sp. EGI_FJ10305 TaxID=3243768 RepID=UPI0035E156B2
MVEPTGWLFLAGAMISAVLTWPLRRRLLRDRLLDLPGARRSHAEPTPRGGGLAIVAALVLIWVAWPGALAGWWQPMTVVVFMAVVGWLEDRHELLARWRFLSQFAVAVFLLYSVGGLHTVSVFGVPIGATWLWSGLGVVAVIWLINLYNFMDGSDGMAAGQGLWAGAVSAVLFELGGHSDLSAFALAAAAAWGGFLLWNRPPARIFMGDVGSLSLGAMVASCAVLGATTGAISIWVSFMISSLFVVDTTATLASRVRRGEQWYTAHRQHAYQRLLDLGWSHARVFGLYQLINVLLVLPIIAAVVRWPHLDTVLAAGLAVILAVGWRVVQSAATSE